MPCDPARRLYLDYNPQCFQIMYEYLQCRKYMGLAAPQPCAPDGKQAMFAGMVKYWGLEEYMNEKGRQVDT